MVLDLNHLNSKWEFRPMKKSVFIAAIALAFGMSSAAMAWPSSNDHSSGSKTNKVTVKTRIDPTLNTAIGSYNNVEKTFNLQKTVNVTHTTANTTLNGNVQNNNAFGIGNRGGLAIGGSGGGNGGDALGFSKSEPVTGLSLLSKPEGGKSLDWVYAGDGGSSNTGGNARTSAGTYDASNNISGSGVQGVGITTISQNTGTNALVQQGVTVQGNISNH